MQAENPRDSGDVPDDVETSSLPYLPGCLGWHVYSGSEHLGFVPNEPEIRRQARKLADEAEAFAVGATDD